MFIYNSALHYIIDDGLGNEVFYEIHILNINESPNKLIDISA